MVQKMGKSSFKMVSNDDCAKTLPPSTVNGPREKSEKGLLQGLCASIGGRGASACPVQG